jgi:23S rRNA pseudouridine2605 synthase
VSVTPAPITGTEATGERLQKVLAQRGLGSRRTCEELIVAGRVRVNGAVAVLGRRVDPVSDRVSVDDVPVAVRPGLVYYLLNKPIGVVSTAADPHGRPAVTGLVPSEPRVHPVGRLDADSEGLLLLTNDGDLTFRLTHPSFGVEKEYLVAVEGTPKPGVLRQLREGVDLEDGRTSPARVARVGTNGLRITIHEGRNRQVRRMCDAVGHPVRRLVRTRIGAIRVGVLAPGEWRELAPEEVRALERGGSSGATGSRQARRAAGAGRSGPPAPPERTPAPPERTPAPPERTPAPPERTPAPPERPPPPA